VAQLFASRFVKSTARTHFVSWILLHVGTYFNFLTIQLATYIHLDVLRPLSSIITAKRPTTAWRHVPNTTPTLHKSKHIVYGLLYCPSCASACRSFIGDISILLSATRSSGMMKKHGLLILRALRMNDLHTFNLAVCLLHYSPCVILLIRSTRPPSCYSPSPHFVFTKWYLIYNPVHLLLSRYWQCHTYSNTFICVMTLGSIMIGIYASWRHQDGVEYNVSRSYYFWFPTRKLHRLILFVSLAWGIITFLLAIVLYSFLASKQLQVVVLFLSAVKHPSI